MFANNAPATAIVLGGVSNQVVDSLRTETPLRLAMGTDVGLHIVAPSALSALVVESGYLSVETSLSASAVTQTGGAAGAPGLRWTDDTSVVFANQATLKTSGTSTIAAPGAFVDGEGTFDSRGDVNLAQGAAVTVNSAFAVASPTQSWPTRLRSRPVRSR